MKIRKMLSRLVGALWLARRRGSSLWATMLLLLDDPRLTPSLELLYASVLDNVV